MWRLSHCALTLLAASCYIRGQTAQQPGNSILCGLFYPSRRTSEFSIQKLSAYCRVVYARVAALLKFPTIRDEFGRKLVPFCAVCDAWDGVAASLATSRLISHCCDRPSAAATLLHTFQFTTLSDRDYPRYLRRFAWTRRIARNRSSLYL